MSYLEASELYKRLLLWFQFLTKEADLKVSNSILSKHLSIFQHSFQATTCILVQNCTSCKSE